MIVYDYHPITKEYLTQCEANPDPLEENSFLIPANATNVEPPQVNTNEAAVFNVEFNLWEVKPDFRGQIFWNKTTKEKVIITKIGIIPDGNLTNTEPSENEIWQNGQWQVDIELWKDNFVRLQRNTLLYEYFWMAERHNQQKELLTSGLITQTNITDSQYIELLDYLQKLRDLPAIIDFENPEFPAKPSFLE